MPDDFDNETKDIVTTWGTRKPKSAYKNLVGQRFSKLIVLDFIGYNKTGKRVWKCQCDCGRIKNILGASLVTGYTKACGCGTHSKRALPKGEAAFNRLFGVYKRLAKERNYDFKLTKDEFRIFTKQNCYYCSIEPSSITKCGRDNGGYIYNGIDRKINSIGYTIENCVSCCGSCNTIKMDLDIDPFLDKIKRIYEKFFT